jgi:hypothetical protein
VSQFQHRVGFPLARDAANAAQFLGDCARSPVKAAPSGGWTDRTVPTCSPVHGFVLAAVVNREPGSAKEE